LSHDHIIGDVYAHFTADIDMTVLMTMKCDVAEWLLQAYRSQWLAMLKVDNGTDLGFVG